MRLHELGLRIDRLVTYQRVRIEHLRLRHAVLLNELLQLCNAIDYMNSFAPVKTGGLQYPDILSRKVTHRHGQTTRSRSKAFHFWSTFSLLV